MKKVKGHKGGNEDDNHKSLSSNNSEGVMVDRKSIVTAIEALKSRNFDVNLEKNISIFTSTHSKPPVKPPKPEKPVSKTHSCGLNDAKSPHEFTPVTFPIDNLSFQAKPIQYSPHPPPPPPPPPSLCINPTTAPPPPPPLLSVTPSTLPLESVSRTSVRLNVGFLDDHISANTPPPPFSSPPSSPPPAMGAVGIADVKSDKSTSYNDEHTDNITNLKKVLTPTERPVSKRLRPQSIDLRRLSSRYMLHKRLHM